MLNKLDKKISTLLAIAFEPLARVSLFLIYFWFGIIKVFGLSPASPLAYALVDRTIGASYFHTMFIILAIFECLIGLLFLIPKFTKLAFYLLLAHMIIVCAPIVLVPSLTWQHAFVPTLEGQYIIKNLALVALAAGLYLRSSTKK